MSVDEAVEEDYSLWLVGIDEMDEDEEADLLHTTL